MKQSREIVCVYQDCPMCGDKGKKLKKLIFDKKLNVRKVSFASDEGKDLCHKAVFEHGIGKMPFFTDGEAFAESLEDLLGKSVKKSVKKAKKSVKKGEKEDVVAE